MSAGFNRGCAISVVVQVMSRDAYGPRGSTWSASTPARGCEFDHAVTRAWRRHPDTLDRAGFTELFRTVSRPADSLHRFPEVHIGARR